MLNLFNTRLARLFVLLFIVTESSISFAGPGDTTWVTVYNLKWLDHYGNYDTVAVFPTGKQYRKIRLHYLLGRYSCPGNPQYCGSWDYTTQIFALPKGKDTLELARVITPYASDWLTKNITHDYIVDVTDYSSVLQDTTAMRFKYDGYSWGFTLTLKLEMIEGVPSREAVSVKKVYGGYFAFGNSANPIESKLPPKSLVYSTPYAALKNSISGHGADQNNCSEFCQKYYQLYVNGNLESQRMIWRDNCGSNPVYPQTGTWIYERANWCPGAIVWPIYHNLDNITAPLTTFTADINMQTYTVTNPSAGYGWETQLISYGNFLNAQDASIEDIISPSSNGEYARLNPVCKSPVIRIKNTGADPILSIALEYGLAGRVMSTYTFNGLMDPLDTTDLKLPPTTAVMGHSASVQFEARIVSVNGATGDDNADNNFYASKTTTVLLAPQDLVVRMQTNAGIKSPGLSETSWYLYDENDNVVAQRTNAPPSKIINDTLHLTDGCYRFELADSDCDGLSFFANSDGSGGVQVQRLGQSGSLFTVLGDFGCGASRSFIVGNYPMAPDLVGLNEIDLSRFVGVFPNPASGSALLRFSMPSQARVSYSVSDLTGNTLAQKNLGTVDWHDEQIDLSGFSKGIYFVQVKAEGQAPVTKKLLVE